MIDDLVSFEIGETDRIVWFDILPNRHMFFSGETKFSIFFILLCFSIPDKAMGYWGHSAVSSLSVFGLLAGRPNSGELACKPSWMVAQSRSITWG